MTDTKMLSERMFKIYRLRGRRNSGEWLEGWAEEVAALERALERAHADLKAAVEEVADDALGTCAHGVGFDEDCERCDEECDFYRVAAHLGGGFVCSTHKCNARECEERAAAAPVETAQGGVDEREQVAACLQDDATKLRDENPDDEMADNMERAAELLATPPAPVGEREEARDGETMLTRLERIGWPVPFERAKCVEDLEYAARALRQPLLAGVSENAVTISRTDAAMTIGLLSNLYDAEDHGCEDFPPGNECGVCGVARLEKRLKAALDAASRAGREG